MPPLSPYTACALVTCIVGLFAGSFLNCWARRIAHEESIIHGRSHCTSCLHPLAPRDLVPLVSWMCLDGKCRYCGARISPRYPATELLCGIAYASIALRYGPTAEALELACFASALLVLSLTDIDTYRIPDACILFAIAVRVAYLVASGMSQPEDIMPSIGKSLANGAAVLLAMSILVFLTDRLLNKPSMGGGDLKLLFVAGMYFGWQQCLALIVMACVFGLVTSAVGARAADSHDQPRKRMLDNIPFGPSLALACWITMLFGADVLAWYWG